MKFRPDGPDIPDSLIAAQERGEVIFICGAGVSMQMGLSGFRGLLLKVYEELGEDPASHLAENECLRQGGRLAGQYDRMLRLLEQRLAASNVRKAQGMRERVREAVRTALATPEEPNLENHCALIKLSRGVEGTLRIVTTNFDTLFEHAWPGAVGVPSHAGASMPQPKTAGCEGVLHLHGRLRDGVLNLDETDLVLTSSEFGDAYLRSGWASRYVYDLVRAYTVVLVGYAADDPPMRYLLEVLESDRERFEDLQKVYALATCEDAEESLEAALWRAKGVEPVLNRHSSGGYASLYRSIREWSLYAEDPTAWRRRELAPLLASLPGSLDKEQHARVISLLSHGDAPEQLMALSPAASWMMVLAQSSAVWRDGATPGPWIASKVEDSAMITACVGLVFDDRARWLIERALDQNPALADYHRRAWELIIAVKPSTSDPDMSWYRLEPRLKRGEATYDVRRVVASLLRPRLVLKKPLSYYGTQEGRPESLQSLLWVDFEAANNVPLLEILTACPVDLDKDIKLLETLNATLNDALDHASDVGFMDAYDRAERGVPSIAPHRQNDHRSGFYPIIRIIADLWSRIVHCNIDRAIPIADAWRESRFTLVRRLWLFAAAHDAVPASDSADGILALDDHDFWLSGGRVEIMRALVAKWEQIPEVIRVKIERRMIKGMPRSLGPDASSGDVDEWSTIVESASFRRLARLRAAGKQLSPESLSRITQILEGHPGWAASQGERDDFGSWYESSYGPSGRPELLANIPDDRLVQEALRLQREQQFEQGDLWRMFCSADSERALRGLMSQADNGAWDVDAWRSLLGALSEKGEPNVIAACADQLLQMPQERFRDLVDGAAALLQRQRLALSDREHAGDTRFWRLWDRVAEAVYAGSCVGGDLGQGRDLESLALNSAGGTLVWTLMESMGAEGPVVGEGLSATFAGRLDKAVTAKSEAGLLARVQLMHSLAYLEKVDPNWVASNLIPIMKWEHPEAIAMWRSQASDQIGSARLFNSLKPDLIRALGRPELSDSQASRLASRLLQVVVWHQRGFHTDYELSPKEMRRVLAAVSDEVRSAIVWQLWKLMDTDDDKDESIAKDDLWPALIGPIFKAIWPLDAHLRSARLSQSLVRMALCAGSALPDAVDAIVDVLVPYRLYMLSGSLRLDRQNEEVERNHPKPFLKLVSALIDPAVEPVPPDLGEVLQRCLDADPTVANEPAYRRLLGVYRARGA